MAEAITSPTLPSFDVGSPKSTIVHVESVGTSSRQSIAKDVLESSTDQKALGDWPNDAGFHGAPDQRLPIELTVSGEIPDYAAGTLFRTGPDGYTVKTDSGHTCSASHWFDGFSKVHRFQISASSAVSERTRVFYTSRSTMDAGVEQMARTGKAPEFTFGQKKDLCQTLFKKVMAVFKQPALGESDVANIGVTISINPPGLPQSRQKKTDSDGKGSHGNVVQSLWVHTDASMLKELDPETLEPIGIADQTVLHPKLTGPFSSAHAKSDPLTGDVFNYNLDLKARPVYRVFRVNASTGKTDILATFNAVASYIHSFFLTKHYVVLCVWETRYALGGLKVLWEKNILDALLPFDPNRTSKWYVIDRTPAQRGVVATYESDPFVCFHTVNAWEEEISATESGKVDIVCDLIRYDNMDILRRFYYENMLSSSQQAANYAGAKGDASRPRIARWRLSDIPGVESSPRSDEKVGTASMEFLAPRLDSAELPTINPKFMQSQHRYLYGVTDRGASSFQDGIVKYDMNDHKPLFWSQHGHSPGEAIFIPDPHGSDEDDGVLLSVVLDGYREQSYLLVLSARTMKELGRAEVGHPVGFGFHGAHLPMSTT